LDIELRPPNINYSDLNFQADKIDDKNVVFFGMGAIKGAGDVAIGLFSEREESGDFKSLSDFNLKEVDGFKGVNSGRFIWKAT